MKIDWRRRFVALGSPTGTRNGAGFSPCRGLYYEPKEKSDDSITNVYYSIYLTY